MPSGRQYVLQNGLKKALADVPHGHNYPVQSVTSAKTLVYQESGSVFNNTGAAGSVTITLPQSPRSGDNFTFFVTTAQDLVIDPFGTSGGIYTSGGKLADGVAYTSSAIGSSLTVVADENADWFVTSETGTWA